MGWYSTNWKRRVALTVINTGAAGTYDATGTIPETLEEFWDAIDSSGYDLRPTAADGRTLLSYDVTGFNKTNRTATLRLDGVTAPGNGNEILLLWLYFAPIATAGDGSSAVTITSAETIYFEEAAPSWLQRTARTQRPGRDRPGEAVLKSSVDDLDVWLDVAPALEQRRERYALRTVHEEPYAVDLTAEDDAGSAASAVVDATACRWAERWGTTSGRRGRELFLRTRIQAGSDGTNYTIKPKLTTTLPGLGAAHRVIDSGMRFGVWVTDQTEPAP